MTRRRVALRALAALAVLTLLALRFWVAEPFAIPSQSMAPTLAAGDHVMVDKLAYRRAAPRAGELAVLRAPGSGEVTLKRIVAVGGDTVAIEDGVLHVDGGRRTSPTRTPTPSTASTSVPSGSSPARSSCSATTGPTRPTRAASAPCRRAA